MEAVLLGERDNPPARIRLRHDVEIGRPLGVADPDLDVSASRNARTEKIPGQPPANTITFSAAMLEP